MGKRILRAFGTWCSYDLERGRYGQALSDSRKGEELIPKSRALYDNMKRNWTNVTVIVLPWVIRLVPQVSLLQKQIVPSTLHEGFIPGKCLLILPFEIPYLL